MPCVPLCKSTYDDSHDTGNISSALSGHAAAGTPSRQCARCTGNIIGASVRRLLSVVAAALISRQQCLVNVSRDLAVITTHTLFRQLVVVV